MTLGPLTPTTYTIGLLAYALVAGMCFSTFSAVVLEIIGDTEISSTCYAFFSASGIVAISYTNFLDTRFHSFYGPRALITIQR